MLFASGRKNYTVNHYMHQTIAYTLHGCIVITVEHIFHEWEYEQQKELLH